MIRYESEQVRALRKELAAKEKELADQKWVLEQFLKSPAWRWTAPVRRAANLFRRLRKGLSARPPSQSMVEEAEAALTDLDLPGELKAIHSSLCRAGLDTFLAAAVTLELPNSQAPEVSIIVVLHNRAELTLACLRSISEHRSDSVEVVVVDNASTDETAQILERLKGARVIRNTENRHFVRAVNQGAAECHGEYLLLLNNDAQLLPGSLQSALKTIRSSPDIGAVGGKVVLLDGNLQEAGSIVWRDGSCTGYGRGDNPFAPMYNFRRDVDYCSAAFLLTSRIAWNRLGGFDDTFQPAYYEETDYSMRLWEQGLRVVYDPGAVILHYEFASSRSEKDVITLQARHQQLFAQRHSKALEQRDLPNGDNLLQARSRDRKPRILLLDDRVPHLWLGSGFPRAHALLRALLHHGCFVTLFPLAVIDEAWDLAYSDIPREAEIAAGLGRGMLESFLRSRAGYYSAIIVSRPHNMETLRPLLQAHPEWFEKIEVIYDAEALFAAREIGLRAITGNPMLEEEKERLLAAELGLTARANRVISVSAGESQVFLDHGIRNVNILGHSIEINPTAPSFDARTGLLFVGAVHREVSPNADSLVWFLTEIFPLIRKKLGDGCCVTIAGPNISARVREFGGPSVHLTGAVPDLTDLYSRSRLFIAPTRYAAGIPQKIHEAAARGLPVVATSLVAAQLGWSERELGVGNTAEEFAARCVEIYTDMAKWKALRDSALERVRRECSPDAFEQRVGEILSGSAVVS